LPLTSLLLLSISTVLTSALSGIVGMAGGMALLSVMTFFLPMQALIPLHGAVQAISNSSRLFFLRKHFHKKIAFNYALGLIPGTFASVFLIQYVSNTTPALLILVALIFYSVFRPKGFPAIMIPLWSFSLVGFVAGFLGPMIGATGPLVSPFFLRRDLKKEEIIATQACAQFFGHVLKFPAFIALGFNYGDYLSMLALLVVASLIGTKLGVNALKKMPESFFQILFKSVLTLSGARLLYTVFWSH
jgi:uncharacterized membrane protein YfcA